MTREIKVIVMSTLLLLWSSSNPEIFAQCNWGYSLADQSCNDPEVNTPCDNVTIANCTRGAFSAPCTGTFALAAWVACAGSGCEHCISCVKVYEILSSGLEIPIASIDSRGSAHGACDNTTTCQQSTTVGLTANTRYAIYVCKTSCPTHLDIGCSDQCGANCTAKGCLGIGTASCP